MNIKKIITFFEPSSELWHDDLSHYGWFKRKFLFMARVVRLVVRGFRNDKCNLHASALTYYTLMSLVPLLALGLSLARVFGGGDIAREKISEQITEIGTQLTTNADTESTAVMTQEFVEHIRAYTDQIFDQIGNISFGTLGGVGLVVLLWMAITMLSQVEQSFNSVWGAPPRRLWRKCADYITIIIIVPFLGIAASTIPVVTMVTKATYGYTFGIMSEEWFARLLRFGMVGLMTSAAFVVLLMFVPNTKIKLRAGLVGGITTAVLFLIWLKICTVLQVGVVKYSKLYGGLAALPILLAWAYMSWQIILFGAELTFAVQHSATFFRDEGAKDASPRSKWRLAVAVTVEMARELRVSGGPFDAVRFASRFGVSGKLVDDVMDALVEARIVSEVTENEGQYALVKSPEVLTVREVVVAVTDRGTSPAALGMGNVNEEFTAFFEKASSDAEKLLASAIASFDH